MGDQFALWLTMVMTGVLLIGVTWIFTDRIVELRHRVNRLEIYRRLDEDKKFWEKTPKREWVGLTNEEIETFKQSCHLGNSGYNTCIKRFAIGIEAKLKEKNA